MSSIQEVQKFTHEQHVLEIPDTYIGDIENNKISSFDVAKFYYKIIFDYKKYKAIDYRGTKYSL